MAPASDPATEGVGGPLHFLLPHFKMPNQIRWRWELGGGCFSSPKGSVFSTIARGI